MERKPVKKQTDYLFPLKKSNKVDNKQGSWSLN